MIKFIHNQAHIKIIIIKWPRYDPPRFMHCPSISVPLITIFIYFIYQNSFFVWPCTFPCAHACYSRHSGKHENILDTSLSRSYEIKLHHKHTKGSHQPFPCLNQSGTLCLRLLPQFVTPQYGSSRTLPLIRTSWLINVMLFLLYPIYSIHSNLSIHPNPTVLRPIQPQYNPSQVRPVHFLSTAGLHGSSTQPMCVAGPHWTTSWYHIRSCF